MLQVVSQSSAYKLEIPRLSSEVIGNYSMDAPVGNGWVIDTIKLEVTNATQTFAPPTLNIIGDPALELTWGFGTGESLEVIEEGRITWGSFDFGTTKSYSKTLSGSPAFNKSGTFKVKARYTTPIASIALDSCSFTMKMSVTYKSTTTNPGSTPQLGDIKAEKTLLQWLEEYTPVILLGGGVIAGLWALGYASEKTGVNVASVQGVAKGAGDLGKQVGAVVDSGRKMVTKFAKDLGF